MLINIEQRGQEICSFFFGNDSLNIYISLVSTKMAECYVQTRFPFFVRHMIFCFKQLKE